MIIGNRLTEIGDKIIIKSSSLSTGINTVDNFYDDVQGVTNDRFFEKLFRYSVDGIIFTNWQPLTLLNLQNVDYPDGVGSYFFEFSYKRVGTDNTGDLSFNFIVLEIDKNELLIDINGNVDTPFPGVDLNSPCVQQYCFSIFKKLMGRGILPEFIERRFENVLEEEDLRAFLKAISCYFALFVCWARTFENFYFIRNYILRFLEQRDLVFCGDEEIEELQGIASDYYSELFKRGGLLPFKFAGDILDNGEELIRDGEFIRLLCLNGCFEFVYANPQVDQTGWTLDRSSLLYRGTTHIDSLNKIDNPPIQQNVLLFNIRKYGKLYSIQNQVINGAQLFLENRDNENFNYIFELPAGSEANLNFLQVNVDQFFSYEFSFFLDFINKSAGCRVVVEVVSYDQSGNVLPFSETKEFAGPSDPPPYYFFNDDLDRFGENGKHLFRGYLFSSNSFLNRTPEIKKTKPGYSDDPFVDRGAPADDLNYSKVGNTFGMFSIKPDVVCQMDFKIKIQNSNVIENSRVRISNVQFKPAVIKRQNSYLDYGNEMLMWSSYKNKRYSADDFREILSRKILDYKTRINLDLIDEEFGVGDGYSIRTKTF